MKRLIIPLLILTYFLNTTACQTRASGESVTSEHKSGKESAVSSDPYLVGPDEFRSVLENNTEAVLLDIRTSQEIDQGALPGHNHVNFYDQDFSAKISELDRDQIYLVYCHSGGRSASTRTMMNQMGFVQVYDLRGGIVAWKNKGFTVQ